jgi:antitoxin YefM
VSALLGKATYRLESRSMSTLPLSEVKARLSEIAEEVAATHERVQITKNGRDYVVLLAAEDLESIEATLELLSDAAAQSRLANAEQDIVRGDVLDEAEVRALLTARRAGSPE